MQQITYIDPRGRELTIHPHSKRFIFESITGIGAGETISAVARPAGLDGDIFQGLRFASREVTLNFHVRGENAQSLYASRQEVIAALSSSRNRDGRTGVLWYSNDYGRWWIPAIIQQGPRNVGRRRGLFQTMQVVFFCPDAAWRHHTAVTDRLAFISGGFQFPLIIPSAEDPLAEKHGVSFGLRGYNATIENTGDVPAPIEIAITGPATRPRVENRTTGQFMAVEKELAAGDVLTISTEHRQKHATIIKAGGEAEPAMGYLDPASAWLQLAAGVNSLEYTSGDDTTTATVSVTLFPRYSGV